MAARSAALPARLVAAVLALCCAAVLAPAAAAPGAHERACGAAFGVLRHCAAAGGNHEDVRARCCGLLEAFQHNGCLCPDCPPGASADATSAKGLLLGAELSPLMDLCGSTALSGPSTTRQGSAQQQAGEDADDDMMADMAGLAAGAQDPMRAQLLARNSAAAAAAAARAAEQRLEQSSDDSPLLDTPEDDYDNLLSDADAAFMLVDPAVAHSYASRAAQLARSVAADAAARVAAGRAAAAELEGELHARLEALLARGGFSLPADSSAARQQLQGGANSAEEDVASASAVSDDSAAALPAAAGRGSPAVLLARADAVPQTAQQRRAAALAAALESQQERNLQQQQHSQQQLLRTAELREQRRDVGVAGRVQQQEGEEVPVRKLSLDITIDADNPEAARRMVSSIAAVLKSFQAAGSAHSQEELAAALESTAAKVAAASSSLGRAGLQPRQLLLEQVEEEGEGLRRPSMCACMDVELPAVDGPAPDLAAAAYRRYLEARLALCRFACQHQQKLAILLVVEVTLCIVWLAIWMVRSGQAAAEAEAEGAPDCHHLFYVRHHHGQAEQQQQQQQQFLIATAADPQWQGELKQPLLGREDSADSSSSRS